MNIYVAKLETEKDNTISYGIYKESELIATVDEQGNLYFQAEYLESLKAVNEKYFENLDLSGAKFELPQELQKEDLMLTPGEIEEAMIQGKLEKVGGTLGTKDINSYSEAEANQEITLDQENERKHNKEQQEKTFENLTSKQVMKGNERVTQDANLSDMIPEIRQKGFIKVGIVYSDKVPNKGGGRFSFIGITENGRIEPIESLQNIEATTTGQKVMAMNNDGSSIQEEQVGAMVELKGRSNANNEKEYLSVKTGQYGILEVNYVRADMSQDKSNRYVSAPIETQSQRPTTREVREFMDKNRNISLEQERNRAKPEVNRDDETRIENIDDTAGNERLSIDDVIVLENGKETTIRNEAAKDKVSPEYFLDLYESRSGNTVDEIIESIHEDIEGQYRGSNTNNRSSRT